MILNNVTTVTGKGPVNMLLKNGKIMPVKNEVYDALNLTFDNALLFPGLVNWHDHLDFNLFPQLGNRTYNNYTEWGNYIHKNYEDEIAAVLKVPLPLRIQWGLFKNLLGGVTTVVNHGEPLVINDALINVEQCHSLHSVQFEKRWKLKLNNPFKAKLPVVIHVGEGTDELSKREIDELINWNLLKKKLIGVHGVAMTARQAKSFEALIWCPESNQFLLDKIAPVDILKKNTTILFGTDSTLTSNWNIWYHIRLARQTNMLTDKELYNSLSPNAGWLKNSQSKTGVVVVRKNNGQTELESFFDTDPARILLVVCDETIKLFDENLLNQLTGFDITGYSKVYIDGIGKYVKGDLPGLMKQIKEYYPEATFPISTN
jgi:cytosine/adenosine deaminase-related metal-dependent hydrolase